MAKSKQNLEKLTILELVGGLTVKQLVAVLTTLGVVLYGVFSIGEWVGRQNITYESMRASMVRELASLQQQEMFQPSRSSRIAIVSEAPDKTVVILALKLIPIPETIKVLFSTLAVQPDAFELRHNIIVLAARSRKEDIEKLLEEGKASVSYLADPSPQLDLLELEFEDDRILAGADLLFDGTEVYWPSGTAGPWYQLK